VELYTGEVIGMMVAPAAVRAVMVVARTSLTGVVSLLGV